VINVSEIEITLPDRVRHTRLRAYVSVLIDGWLRVGEMRITEKNGRLTLWFPSRPLHAHCPACSAKVEFKHTYCWGCGAPLPDQTPREADGSLVRMYANCVHPIRQYERSIVERAVFAAYRDAIEGRSRGLASRLESRRTNTPPVGAVAS
jgi:DNA-binding cell septation regulator SpoVG